MVNSVMFRTHLESDKISLFDISAIYLRYVIYKAVEILKIANRGCLYVIQYLCNRK